jgi:hypothetical protein
LKSWTDTNQHDPGIVFVELFAFVGDLLSYFQDRVAAEASARRRWRAAALVTAAIAVWCCRRSKP